jgi:hypothetical protein
MKLIKKRNIQQEASSENDSVLDSHQSYASNSQRMLELIQARLLGNIPTDEFDRHEGTGEHTSCTDWLDHMEDRESSREDMCLPTPGEKNPVLSPDQKEKTSRKSPAENDS